MTRDDITLPREVVKLALEALEYYRSGEDYQPTPASEAITALRTALVAEQPKPEPVESAKPDHEAIRWQLCLLAQTEEFSDEVRNQIGRGVWLIDVLQAALRREGT